MDKLMIPKMPSSPIAARRREGFPGQYLSVLPQTLRAQAQEHSLLRGLFLTATGYFPEAPHHLVERPEGVPEIILIACISGEGWLNLGTEKRHTVGTGNIAFILSGIAHSYGSDDRDPWSIRWAHFDGRDASAYIQMLKVTAAKPIVRIPPELLQQLQFEQLHVLLENGSSIMNSLAASARLRLILANILKSRITRPSQGYPISEVLEKNMDWMRLNCHRRITLRELAKQAGISTPHYCALFKTRTGHSPLNYFHRLKVQAACQLLALTQMPIHEIAMAVSFEDSFYFSRFFKKQMGQSPRLFRDHQTSGR